MYHLEIHVSSGWVSTRTVYQVGVVGGVRDQVCRAAFLAEEQDCFS